MATEPIAFPFFNRGFVAAIEGKQLPPGAFPSAVNIISEKEGGVTIRRGSKLLGTMPGDTARVHTINKLSAFPGEVPMAPSLNPRYFGDGSNIYRSTTLGSGAYTKINPTAVCTAPSSAALSRLWTMASYASGVTSQPWAFFAGEKAMLKDSALHPCAANSAKKWGITPAFATATAEIGAATGGSTIGPAVFHGTGLNDAVASGIFTGSNDSVLTVVISLDINSVGEWDTDATYSTDEKVTFAGVLWISLGEGNTGKSPDSNPDWWSVYGSAEDRAQWYINDGGRSEFEITGNVQAIADGISFRFGSTTGHTVGDSWTIGLGGTTDSTGLLDGGAIGSPAGSVAYNYRYLYRCSETGQSGNPSAPMDDNSEAGDERTDSGAPDWHAEYVYITEDLVSSGGILWISLIDDNLGNQPDTSPTSWEKYAGRTGSPIRVHLKAVVVKGWGTDDTQVDEIVIYRSGGILNDGIYRRVGTVNNPGLGTQFSYVDHESDVAIQYRPQLEEDNDPPVFSTLQEERVSTSLAAIFAGRQVIETVDPIFTGVYPGTIVRPEDNEACVIEEVITPTQAMIWAQHPHPVGSACHISSIVGQPCTLSVAAFDSLFLAGDPYNPQTLYKSKSGRPESFPLIDAAGVSHTINVGTPSNGIVAIAEFRGNLLCMNVKNFFEVAIFNGAMYGPNVTPANRGLAAPKAWCVADNEIWYLAYDGVWSWGGSESTPRSKIIDPIFHSLSVPDPLGSGRVFQPLDKDPKALQFARMEYYRDQIHFLYLDTSGDAQELVYDVVADRWLPMDKGEITAIFREEDTNNLLIAREGGSGALVYLDDYLSSAGLAQDDGSEIQAQLSTGWIDGGDQCVVKVLDEVLLDIDPQGLTTDTILTINAFYDYSATAGDSFYIKGLFANVGAAAPARRWLSLQPDLDQQTGDSHHLSGYGRQAQVVAFQFLMTTSDGLRPTLYGMRFKARPAGEITAGPYMDWSDLGHPHDKRLKSLTIEYDTTSTARTLVLDTMSGIAGATVNYKVATFSLNNPIIIGPGRAKCAFPIADGVVCKLARIRAISTLAADTADSSPYPAATAFFRILSMDPDYEKLPPDISLWTEAKDFGYPYEKIAKVLNVQMDTGGVDCRVDLVGDGDVMDTFTINTTANDRARMVAVQKDQIAKLWKLANTPGPNGKAQLWDWNLLFQQEPPNITYWRSFEQTFGYSGWKFIKQMWVQYWAPEGLVVLIESDTGSYTKVLPAHTTRSTERFLLPTEFGDGYNKSKVYVITFGSAGITGSGEPSVQWGIPGDFVAGATLTLNAMIRKPMYFSELRWNVSESVGLMPVGADAVLDVVLSADHGSTWASILNDPKLVIPADGPNYGVLSVADFSIPTAAQGDWVKITCVSVGSDVAGRGLQGLLFGNEISPASGPNFKIFPSGSTIEWIAGGADRHTGYQQTSISEFWTFPVGTQ